MKNTDAIVRLNTYNFEALIHAIRNLSDSLIQTAFFYNERHYQDDPAEAEDWFALYYSTAAAANEIISASAEVVSIALVNGDIEIIPGDTSWVTARKAPEGTR